MNHAFRVSIFAVALALSACASRHHSDFVTPPQPPITNRSTGHWEHRYPNNKKLVGVWIQQFPDNPFDAPRYEAKHPCMVYYIFADGRHHGFHYEPDGTVESEGWSETPAWILNQLAIVYRPDTLQALIRRAKTR